MALPVLNVLSIDDDNVIQVMITHALNDGAVRFTSAHSGPEGLAQLQREHFDLVLLDIGMPDMDGFEILSRIKGSTQTKSIPVILLTAENTTEDKVRGFELGAVDYITKPFEVAELRARVRAQLRTQLLQKQLVEARKLESLGHLAAGIAHEINTPIQFVGDNLAFLREAFSALASMHPLPETAGQEPSRMPGPTLDAQKLAELRYFLDEIPKAITQSLEGVDRVATIVRSMREFSYPNVLRKELADVNRAIQSATVVARHEWKNVADLVLELDPALPLARCAAGQITQVLVNLIVNAAHAISDQMHGKALAKGRIQIATELDGSHVVIRVADSGPGIPSSVRDNLFDPFTTTKEVGRGTGQGLYIVHQVVVEGHGGEISFDSDPGVGTTFHIRLPLEPPQRGEDAAEVAVLSGD